MARKFVKNNQGFRCIVCGADVFPHPSSSRDHCNRCLYSLHIDINPGDRTNPCQGILEPVGLDLKRGEKRIVYRCQECRAVVVNAVAPDDSEDKLLELAALCA